MSDRDDNPVVITVSPDQWRLPSSTSVWDLTPSTDVTDPEATAIDG